MEKRQQIIDLIQEYLYDRDDIMDLNEVPGVAADLAKRLIPIV